jgi:Skp family chaperone for outer membrane proteins
MKNKYSSLFLLGILVFLLIQQSRSVETQQETIKIGIVNINAIFEKYTLTAEYEKEATIEFENKMKAYQEMAKEIETLRDAIELFESGSMKWLEKNKELQQKIFHAAFFEKWEKQQFNDRLKKLTENIYNNIRIAINDYAQRNGYTLILKTEDDDLKSESRTELKLKINDKKVLYYSPSYDITNEIIRLLNR